MRIAISFPGCYRRGGVERVVLETANFLAGRKHDVHLFCSEWDGEAVDRRVTVHPVETRSGLPLGRVRLFPSRCDELMERAGTFDAHSAFGVLSPPGGVVWVGSVHAAWLQICREQRSLRDGLRQRLNPYHHLILRLERHIFGGRRYRRLIALTDQVKQDLITHYAVPTGDVDVLSNGFAEAEFNVDRRGRDREPVRRELGISADDRVVIFVANETERKGFGPLLRAIATLDDERVHLLAVGRLNAAAHRREIASLGMTGRVHWTGPTDDVGRYFAAADVFALPTQYEAWGLVIVEALACGLPVLTSRLAGAAVAVQEGRTGELLDDPRDVDEIANGLRRLLRRGPVEPETIAASVQHYRWCDVLARYETILLGDPAGRGSDAEPGLGEVAAVDAGQTSRGDSADARPTSW